MPKKKRSASPSTQVPLSEFPNDFRFEPSNESTGIYQRGRMRSESRERHVAELKENCGHGAVVAETVKRWRRDSEPGELGLPVGLSKWLREIEAELRRIIASNSGDAIAEDCEEAMVQLNGVWNSAQSRYLHGLTLAAFQLGRLVERIGVRPFEKPALSGRKSFDGARTGGKAKRIDDETREQIRAAWADRRAANPDEKLQTINSGIAKMFGCSDRTVWTILRESKNRWQTGAFSKRHRA